MTTQRSLIPHQSTSTTSPSSKSLALYTERPARIPRPSQEQRAATVARTKAMIEQKLMLATPVVNAPPQPPQFVQYTPPSGGQQRIIRVVEAEEDPLEPPKHRVHGRPTAHALVASTAVQDAVPVLHDQERETTREALRAAHVPPSVSKWTNPLGHIVPLEVRLAMDAERGVTPSIGEGFSTLASALLAKEGQLKQEVEARNQQREALRRKELAAQEEEFRQIAENVRSGGAPYHSQSQSYPSQSYPSQSYSSQSYSSQSYSSQQQQQQQQHQASLFEQEAQRVRDQLRGEQRKRIKEEERSQAAKRQRGRDQRDVTEAMALGETGSSMASEADVFDSRLFQHSEDMLSEKTARPAKPIAELSFKRDTPSSTHSSSSSSKPFSSSSSSSQQQQSDSSLSELDRFLASIEDSLLSEK